MENKIQQGDQFAIPFILKCGGRLVVPSSYQPDQNQYYHADEVKIEVGTVVKSSDDESELKFENNKWLYYISETESVRMEGTVPWQFCIIRDNNIYYSSVYTLNVLPSLNDLTEASGRMVGHIYAYVGEAQVGSSYVGDGRSK